MDDGKVDRLARAFAKIINRRQLAAVIGVPMGTLGQRVARAFQLGPATCGEQGAVCTLLSGCCDGLTCVTSAINTSYGICVPGEGGMVSTGTSLISPFSETAVEEVGALMQDAPAAPTTDPQAEREAHLAEIRARKDAKQNRRQDRRDQKRLALDNRKEEHDSRRLEAREADEVALGPQLQVELQFMQADGNSGLPGDQLVPIDVVRATNRDDVSVVLTRIETVLGTINGSDLTTSQFTISPGESYLFVSGLQTEDAADAASDQYRWMSKVACDDTVGGQGYRVKAAFSRGAENHEFIVYCNGPYVAGVVEAPAGTSRRKRKRNNHLQHHN